MPFEFLEHTSDLFIRGTGKSLKEALEAVAEGMFRNMGKAKKEGDSLEVESKGHSVENLVVEFYSDIVADCELNKLIPKRLEIIELDRKNLRIKARVYGEKGVPENIIKAVTYHLLKIEESKEKTIVEVLFDI
ncbi:archease [Candidatus Micrarchaeota archaeon]|nr:archease [Candidatus Micrarchaeota archaeon]